MADLSERGAGDVRYADLPGLAEARRMGETGGMEGDGQEARSLLCVG
jgi:hypothetical protein